MKYFTPERIEYFKKAYKKFKDYKALSLSAIVFAFLASVFEGFSLGAILPFLQNLTNPNSQTNFIFPFFENTQKALFAGSHEDTVLKIMIFALAMIIFKSIFNYLRIITTSKASTLIRRDLQNDLFNATCNSSYKFFSNEMKTGSLISATNNYTKSIIGFYFVILEFISRFSRIIIYAVALFMISWKFTAIAIIFELMISPFIKKILAKIKKFSLYATENTIKLHSQMIEKFGNIRLVRIFNMENYEIKKFDKTTTRLAELNYKSQAYHNLIAPLTESSVMLAIIILFTISIKIIKVDIVFYLPFILAYLYIFLKAFNEINLSLKSISKIFEFIEPYKAYEKILAQAKKEKIKNGKIELTKFSNKIIFDKIHFSYNPSDIIFDALNLQIKRGSFTAIVGPTGAGKTTFVNLLAGLITPTSGRILIDDKNIQTLKIETWRNQIGYISQDISILDDTVANNISYGKFEAIKKEIIEAAKTANAHDFIMDLPEKYDTILGEKGAKISGGQKQRITMARAIIRQPEILILDEATSSLDTKTEHAIQKSLANVFKNKTIITIAHRLTTIQKADNILVLDQGKIVEQGKHTDLLKQNGFYKKYYDIQFE